jgi:hypothetical protein
MIWRRTAIFMALSCSHSAIDDLDLDFTYDPTFSTEGMAGRLFEPTGTKAYETELGSFPSQTHLRDESEDDDTPIPYRLRTLDTVTQYPRSKPEAHQNDLIVLEEFSARLESRRRGSLHGSAYHDREPKKSRRTTISTAAKRVLQAAFDTNPYPSSETRESLSVELGVKAKTVSMWFANARSRQNGTACECTSPCSEYSCESNAHFTRRSTDRRESRACRTNSCRSIYGPRARDRPFVANPQYRFSRKISRDFSKRGGTGA